ncbi:MAG: SDR family oxidoreductase [Gemmatimonadota bacterium]|jgi:NAD(P)-dependent dehydrogenase (short-subunit alcohol dehydrogenase family)
MPDGTFKNHTVLVTGGSRGIGREISLRLAREGARVALMARSRADLETIAAECRAEGSRALIIPGDVGSEADCAVAVRSSHSEFGSIDMLVANAGISMLSAFEDLEDLESLERVMRVNYLGAVHCTRHALPHLIASRGRIVAVSSLTGLTGVPTRTGYAASKHAMRGFFDSLRIELRRHGVSVTVAYPGFVDTGIRERAVGEGTGRGSGRPMSAPECANRILDAAVHRRREVVMTAKGQLGRWMKLVAPDLVDRIAARAVEFES